MYDMLNKKMSCNEAGFQYQSLSSIASYNEGTALYFPVQ